MPRMWILCLCLALVLPISYSQDDDDSQNYYRREHTLTRPYQGTGMSISNWDFMGNVLVTSNYIRMTGDVQSQRGAIWNLVPVSMKWWEVQLNFKVTGSKGDLFGDGFAFWYVKDPMQQGEVFGSRDYFSGLAVIADTYSNHNGEHKHGHPYLSAIVNNGTMHYDHDMDGTHTQLGGCTFRFRNLEEETLIAIAYVDNTVTVRTSLDGATEWNDCLHVPGVHLPTGYHFGVSAATGDLSDAHDMISFVAFDIPSQVEDGKQYEDRSGIQPSADSFEPEREHVADPEPKSSSGWMIFKLIFGVVFIVVAVVVGGFFWNNYQENQRKRFY